VFYQPIKAINFIGIHQPLRGFKNPANPKMIKMNNKNQRYDCCVRQLFGIRQQGYGWFLCIQPVIIDVDSSLSNHYLHISTDNIKSKDRV